ncbi:MAG: 1-acyl-sn-glycerol-3-phosphate acyltransferase [Thermoleophilaceae bacterium]
MSVHGVTDGPLFPDDAARGARIWRRTRGIAIEFVAFVLVTVLFPVLIVVAGLVDLVLWLKSRKPWMGVRLVAMGWWFLFADVRVLLAMLAIKLSSSEGSIRRRRLLYGLRIHWMRSHIGGIRVLFGLGFEVEDIEAAGPGPVVILMRHASIIDNALPDYTAGRAHQMGLRFVIKKELESLPVIDIGGHWVPSYFVRRASADPVAEAAALRRLAHNFGPDSREGVLIYPEGTRCTAKKLAAAKAAIAERQPEISPLANRLQHVLPPRLSGPLALMDEAAGTDIVFCGHVGFDGLRGIGDIWRGSLAGTTIRVKFWRYSGSDVPVSETERVAWLYERWQILDDWIGGHLASDGPPPA